MADPLDAWDPTDAQAELVERDGARFVEACPGAGKTRALVARYSRLTAGAARRGVALISFTNAAVEEVRRRCRDPRILQSPNFAGTFDSFINRFITGPAMASGLRQYPRFTESWWQIPAASFSSDGLAQGLTFNLDQFDWTERGDYRFSPERATGPYGNALRAAYERNPAATDAAAVRLRNRLVNENAIVPCSESRHIATRLLVDTEHGPAAIALLHRFSELIVDEAQDCGLHELAVLRAVGKAGIPVVAVGDLDQAIFEFRRATPDAVRQFADDMGRGTRLTGNFRSSPAIVRVGGLLRASDEEDDAVGPEASNRQEVVLAPFESLEDAGAAVRTALVDAGIEQTECVVLAHRADDAAGCAGGTVSQAASGRAVVVFANAALSFSATDDPAHRRRALRDVEYTLLRAAGAPVWSPLEEGCEHLGVSVRWLRDAATRVVLGADPKGGGRQDYTVAVRGIVNGLDWPSGVDISNHRLATPPQDDWVALGLSDTADPAALRWMTVHGAKGREFNAVALVIPKVLRADSDGMTCLDHWEQGSDAESRRVLYVGATRARKLLIVAVHVDHCERLQALLGLGGRG